ncbi:Pyruvate dehydrogenase E1 component subunit beta [Planctomycetes bacterium Poly30]|uniref:3-methyl-2-oxobutanoate dehydrogenase (2-methylpropanoyl-transferring) n=1 Tax=Saltatorellus ferox TaxID=2528018 RepID=A0A518EN83_9BACT|nr:Pyruvate dehydrogenase E1 component subunit beta [Planctomycetes bacterium Poly30]
MTTNRVAVVEGNLDAYLDGAVGPSQHLAPDDPLRPGTTLTARRAVELWEDQILSRCLDVAARDLKRDGQGFYTISSAGHEQNAVLGAQLRTTDPCFLHYRSGGLMAARMRQIEGSTPLFDTLLSFTASKDDPVSAGRHKVWGSKVAWVPPQTSTIASHVPKAVGTAFSLSRAKKLGIDTGLPDDAITCCTFGDASVNHATALAGINSARYAWRRMNPTPVLFVCEDNQRGISVETPRRWIRDFFSRLEHLRYFEANGHVDEVWDTVALAIQTCRTTRQPTFLRLRTHRLWGHAGSDVESAYMSQAEIEAEEAKDPVLNNARRLIELGAATPAALRAIVRSTRERVKAASVEAKRRPKLTNVAEIIAPLAPVDEPRWRIAGNAPIDQARRVQVFGERLPENAKAPTRRTMGARINDALHDEMIRRPNVIAFGEDVGRKGGVYGVTQNLQQHFGRSRCFDTLLDETTILGVAQGSALVGLLPVPEVPYLAYLHNAIDQIRGEACSLQFFSAGQYQNPMVVRIAGLAYQRGFGGHFHNDNSIGALREIPGLSIAVPSNGADAVRLFRGALAMAAESGRVSVFLEPIALYHERDLYEEGDGLWLSDYPVPDGSEGSCLLPGEVGIAHPDHKDVLIVSYANGYRLALRAARQLEADGIRARVLDMRWLNPLPMEAIRAHADECGAVLVADECRATAAGPADAIICGLVEGGFRGRIKSVRSADTYIPLGDAANIVLLSEDDIVRATREVLA